VTDQLEDLFAGFRADAISQVRAPGVEAARRTVHRRRTSKAVGGAAFVAVVAAGGIGSHLLGPLPFTQPGEPDPATLAKRQSRAASAVGLGAGDRAQTPRSMQGIAAAGVIATGLLVAGTYTLRLACAGPGRLAVLFRIRETLLPETAAPDRGVTGLPDGTDRVARSSTQDCATREAAVRTFTLPGDAPVEAELRPDDDAVARAGYAFTLTLHDADRERLTQQVRGRMQPDSTTLYETSGPVRKNTIDVHGAGGMLNPGRYRLRYLCGGVGRVRVAVGVHHADTVVTSTQTVTCGPSAPAATFPFEIRPGDSFSASTEPDADALGQSAHAELLERV